MSAPAPEIARPPNIPRNITAEEILAALRQGSPILSRHPTGVPIYVEDWAYIRGWTRAQSANGTGDFKVVTAADLELVQDVRRHGVFNGKQMCELTSPGVNYGYVRLFTPCLATLPNMRLGMEVNFAIPYGLGQLQARMNRMDLAEFNYCTGGTRAAEGSIRYTPATDILSLFDGVAEQPLLTNVFGTQYNIGTNFLRWHNVKFIFDMSSGLGSFVTVFFNDQEIDLSTYTSRGQPPIDAQRVLRSSVRISDIPVANQYHVYFGNIILTMEEP